MTRVFITGMGAITPIGNDVQSFWRNLLAGKSGSGHISAFDTEDMPHNIACEIKDFDPTQYIDRKTARRIHRSSQLAVAVARQAIADAKLVIDSKNGERVGVLMATGGGGITEIEAAALDVVRKGWRSVGPFVVPSAMANAISCIISIEVGAKGPVMTSTAACASGHYSVIEGYHYLQRGEADVIIAGGAESLMSMLTMAAFALQPHRRPRASLPSLLDRP
jgi:3-oxoacyl-[acyl-carrier-protein] synthase II